MVPAGQLSFLAAFTMQVGLETVVSYFPGQIVKREDLSYLDPVVPAGMEELLRGADESRKLKEEIIMMKLNTILLASLLLFNTPLHAAEKLVLDLDSDSDLISMTHNIEGFLFKPTMNVSTDVAGNISDRFIKEPLKQHLAATALVRINGELAGFATEQELLTFDQESGRPMAESAWLITLNYPGATGVLAVNQREDASKAFGLVNQVMQDPGAGWEDKFQRFLSSSNAPRITMATGDLSAYLGGRFEEYNFVNPADFNNFKRFRGKIQFVIYPSE